MGGLASLLDGVPGRLREPLIACVEGELPANIALMRLLIEALDRDEAETTLRQALERAADSAAADTKHLAAVMDLLRRNPQAWVTVKGVLRDVEHDRAILAPEDGVASCAAAFDRAARALPEASVALYALGNPELLNAATAEVVDRIRSWGLVGQGRKVLDVGCGIGRFEEALASEVEQMVGIDISAEMIMAARRRCAGLANVEFHQSSGRDLSPFADDSFDLVLAVDCMPYVAQSGTSLVERHVAEAARVLKPGGDLLIINFTYQGDPGRDRAEVERLAHAFGFNVLRAGTREFRLWDGLTFHLARNDNSHEVEEAALAGRERGGRSA
jgi:ubiquinone/menaquinone biosynthesis C-methylase UbiE